MTLLDYLPSQTTIITKEGTSMRKNPPEKNIFDIIKSAIGRGLPFLDKSRQENINGPEKQVATGLVKDLEMREKIKPTPTPAPSVTHGRIPQTAGASNVASDAIMKAAQEYNIPQALLFDIAFAESSLHPGKLGPTEDVGLFQFIPGTWTKDLANYAGMQGSTLKDFDPSLEARLDPYKNAMAAAYLIKNGQLGRWKASKGKWGQNWSEEELNPYYAQTPKEARL